jgi:hypothetical protein
MNTFRSVGLPLYLIRLPSGEPLLLGATALPDGRRWKCLPLFETVEQAEAFRAVATIGREEVGALTTWSEVVDAANAAKRLGCDRVVWNPGQLHAKEQANQPIADLFRLIETKAELN